MAAVGGNTIRLWLSPDADVLLFSLLFFRLLCYYSFLPSHIFIINNELLGIHVWIVCVW